MIDQDTFESPVRESGDQRIFMAGHRQHAAMSHWKALESRTTKEDQTEMKAKSASVLSVLALKKTPMSSPATELAPALGGDVNALEHMHHGNSLEHNMHMLVEDPPSVEGGRKRGSRVHERIAKFEDCVSESPSFDGLRGEKSPHMNKTTWPKQGFLSPANQMEVCLPVVLAPRVHVC
jgi:hypothetical protein